MAWFEDFKKFIQRGSVIDLAVGVIIGAAFGKIVSSLVADVVMPLISIITGNVNISSLKYQVASPTDPNHILVTLSYGNFLQALLDFFLIAFCVFWMVKAVNALHKKEEKPPDLTTQEKLLTEIRDLLKTKAEPAAAPPSPGAGNP